MPKMISQIAELGSREHWLIKPEALAIHAEKAFNAGGFGMVLAGSYMCALVAVKIVNDANSRPYVKKVNYLIDELCILQQCRHPNLVQFKGLVCDTTLCQVGLVLEYAAAGDLHSSI